MSVDGSMLGMQVRAQRRRRLADEVLPPLPPVEDGHFREVKTGVLLLPEGTRRVLAWPAVGDPEDPGDMSGRRRPDLRAAVGQALRGGLERAGHVMVTIGDGAEWIWNRASLFARRCAILDFWHAVEKAWE